MAAGGGGAVCVLLLSSVVSKTVSRLPGEANCPPPCPHLREKGIDSILK